MSRLFACIARLSIAAAVFSTAALSADDYRPLPLNEVPQPVRDAVMKKFPDAKPQSASQGTEDNKTFIDVHILVKTQKIWVTCDPDGTIRTIDREISLRDLPPPVTAALNKKFPKAAVRLVNEITDIEITQPSAPTYDIALTFNKKPLIAIFSSTGELLEQLGDDP